jgi:hypothetical protein
MIVSELLSNRVRVFKFALGSLLLLAVARCVDPLWNWPRYQLPVGLEIDAVLASDSEDGLGQGCRAAIYSLAPTTLKRLDDEGIFFLDPNRLPKGEKADNRYGPWRETPGDIDLKRNGEGAEHTIFGLYALGGCGSSRTMDNPELRRALTIPGSFYATTGNEEGIVIVAPKAKLAGYFYVG